MLRIKPHVPKVIPTNLVERAGGRLLLRHLGDRRGWWRLLLGFSLLLNPGERKTSVQFSHYRGDQETPLQNEGQGAYPAINCCGHRRTGLAGPSRASETQQSAREKREETKAPWHICMPVFKNRVPVLFGPSPQELQGFGAQCIHSAHQLAGPRVPFQAEFKEPEAHTHSGCTADELPLMRNGPASSGRSAKLPAKAKD